MPVFFVYMFMSYAMQVAVWGRPERKKPEATE